MNPLQLLAVVPMTVAAAVRRSERRAIVRLQEAGANTAERAIVLERRRPLSGFAHDRLERAGVLQRAGNDRYYLNEARYEVYRGRRTRVTVVLALLVIGIVILYLLRDLL